MIIKFNNFINESSTFSDVIQNKNYIHHLHSTYKIDSNIEYTKVIRKDNVLDTIVYKYTAIGNKFSYIIIYENYIITVILQKDSKTIIDIYDTIINETKSIRETYTSDYTLVNYILKELNIRINITNTNLFKNNCNIYKFKFKIPKKNREDKRNEVNKIIFSTRDYILEHNSIINMLLSNYIIKITDIIKTKKHDFLNSDLDIEYLNDLSNDLKFIKKIRSKTELVIDYDMIVRFFEKKLNLRNIHSYHNKYIKSIISEFGVFIDSSDIQHDLIIDYYNNAEHNNMYRELILFIYKNLLSLLNLKKYEDILADKYDINKIVISKDNKIFYDGKLITQTDIYDKLDHLISAKNFDLF